jgi:hypothetical protein
MSIGRCLRCQLTRTQGRLYPTCHDSQQLEQSGLSAEVADVADFFAGRANALFTSNSYWKSLSWILAMRSLESKE